MTASRAPMHNPRTPLGPRIDKLITALEKRAAVGRSEGFCAVLVRPFTCLRMRSFNVVVNVLRLAPAHTIVSRGVHQQGWGTLLCERDWVRFAVS